MIANRVHKHDNTPKELEFCVIVKLKSQPNNLRCTYTKMKGGKLILIEEVDELEQVISTSRFKGKSCSGFCSDDIKRIKPFIGSITPTDWIKDNTDLLVDAYYRIH